MNFKYYKTTPLVVSIIVISGLIDLVLTKWITPFLSIHLPSESHFRLPTTLSLLILFFVIYDRYLWRYPILNILTTVPNMTGRYSGMIRFTRNEIPTEKKCFIEVTQTSSKVKLHTYFNNEANETTSSKSLIEEIKLEEDGFFDIYTFYLNIGDKHEGKLDSHEGANKLRFFPKGIHNEKKLMGYYFTNRQKQTRGEIEAVFVSTKLEGRF